MALITFTENIAPSRVERFEEVLEKIRDAAMARKIPFKWEKKDAIEIPVQNQANGKYVSGAYQDAQGTWVVQRVPFTVTHGPLDKSGFMPIAELVKMPNGDVQIRRFGTVSDEEMEKIFPKINARVKNWSPHCDHCNPAGDKINRFYITLLVATRDITMKTKKGNIKFKEGDLSQVGSACLDKYTDIDPQMIAELYRLERAKRVGGVRAAPNDPTGWGWKTMDLIDFFQRCVMFYGHNEQAYLNKHGGLARQREGEEAAKRLYSATSEKFKVGYRMEGGTGIFPKGKGRRIMQARLVTMNGKTYFQPYNLQDWGVQAMLKKYDGGDANACTEMPLLDENGVQEYDDNGQPLFVAVPNLAAVPQKIINNNFDRLLPLDDTTIEQANSLRKWLMRLRPTDIPGKEDLVNNMKAILKYGYVGEKSANDAAEAWRYWQISTYDERRRKVVEEAERKRKEQIQAFLTQRVPDGKWRETAAFGNIEDILRRISPYNDYTFLNRAYDRRTGQLWISDANYAQIEAALEAKKEKAERRKAARDEHDRRIADEGMAYYGSAKMIQVFGQVPSRQDLLTILEWDKNSDELNEMLFGTRYDGTVNSAYLRPAEQAKLKQHYGVGQPAQPVAPPVVPPVAPPVAQPAQAGGQTKKPAITEAEANRMKDESIRNSTQQGSIGDRISISGYVTMTSKPFRNRQNGYGQTIQVVSDAGDTYVIFMYNRDKPTLGQYICLDDYEIVSHTTYYYEKGPNKGLTHKQTVINAPGQTWRDCTV